MSLILFIVIAGVPLYLLLRPAEQTRSSEVKSPAAADARPLFSEAKPHA
jgi:hypothetical protein